MQNTIISLEPLHISAQFSGNHGQRRTFLIPAAIRRAVDFGSLLGMLSQLEKFSFQ